MARIPVNDLRGLAAMYAGIAVLLGGGTWVAWGPGHGISIAIAIVLGMAVAYFAGEAEIAQLKEDLGDQDDELDEYDTLRRLVDDALFGGFTTRRRRTLEGWLNDHPSHRRDLLLDARDRVPVLHRRSNHPASALTTE